MKEYKYENVIENIKKLIKEKGMKQGAVAEKAGFTPQEFSNMMHGGRKLLRVEYIPRIAFALGVTSNEIYAAGEKKAEKEETE